MKNIIAKGGKKKYTYVYVHELEDNARLMTTNDELYFQHKRLGPANVKTISKLSKYDLVRGIPKCISKVFVLCEACQLEKQVKTSFKSLARLLVLKDHQDYYIRICLVQIEYHI